jgi:hypothetical protein
MIEIHAYDGIPKSEITKLRTTSSGKKYSLNHPKELIVPMRYTPRQNTKNSQGWERDQKHYWSSILEHHPQCLSTRNQKRIRDNQSPKVDKTFIESFPQHKEFNRSVLYHHHIGGNGDAVALPVDIHKGYGEIHNIENNLGVTKNAERFTEQCHKVCAKDQKYYGQTSREFQNRIHQENNREKTAINSKTGKPSSAASAKTLLDKKQGDQKPSKESQTRQNKSIDRSH